MKFDGNAPKLLVYTEDNIGAVKYEGDIREVWPTILDAIANGQQPKWIENLTYFSATQIGHSAGTLRMGAADSGVVDETQRFLSYENLYVADVSVFPSILAAKPSLTLSALCLRLADTIIAQLPRPSGDVVNRGIRSRAAIVDPSLRNRGKGSDDAGSASAGVSQG